MVISDLEPGVIQKMGNRTDLKSRVPDWVKKSIQELTQSYDFEELKVTGPSLYFTAGLPYYPKNYFTVDNEDWTNIDSWFLQISAGVSSTVNQSATTQVGWMIKGRALMVVDPLSKIPGPPTFWSQHGSTIIVGFQPDQAYPTYMRYQKKHPFPAEGALDGQQILMPSEWQDVIEYCAAIRGAAEERAFDYVNQYRDMVFGDTKFRITDGQDGNPGLIFGLTSQQRRNLSHNERQLQPIVQRYQ